MKRESLTSRSSWLARRNDGIGASEVSAILGLVEYASAWSVWRRKVDREPPVQGGNLEMLEAGRLHEPTISRWNENNTGRQIEDPGDYTIFWSEERPYCFATPDRLLLKDGQPVGVLELKCAWYEQAKGWKTRVPLAYQVQVQHQLYCTGLKEAVIAVLLDGYRFKWFSIPRHDRMIEAMLRKLDEFWALVQSETPPEADFTVATSQAIAAHYPTDNGNTLELPEEFTRIHETREKKLGEIKRLKRDVDECNNKLKAAIGEHHTGVLLDGETGYRYAGKPGKRSLRKVKARLMESEE